ncbi:cytochrome c oxidase subunit 6C [Sitodiplosis mosellana]|uniref:cytochrome c oxidase subunit 6C n=1 Tax=Sitodiplosis mosellana TaxID=263140 RepID=UPI002444AA90|nr:cytochrome c oxidase subunit 6C [Sitodiplosis mosellana]XP_055300095.1 cytochrome c oxidase subunit 6C [Sitodiplosis mosellana]
MSDAVASSSNSLPRPQLKGRHAKFMTKHLAISIGFALASVYLTKVFVNDKRKAAYAEYYKNYDIEENFNRIRKLGLFESCGPDDE